MTRATKLRGVVFDLDGTLIDSLPLVLRSIAHAIEPYAPARPTMEIFAHLGGPPRRFMPGLLGGEEHLAAALVRMNDFHNANEHSIEPFAQMAASLATLRHRGVVLAIWTGRDRRSGEGLLRARGLAELFSTVVYGDDLPTHKPEPAGMKEILRRLDLPATDVVFVGDADVDVQGGVGAGVDTVLIRHSRPMDPAVCAQAWQTVDTPEEAFQLLLDLTPANRE